MTKNIRKIKKNLAFVDTQNVAECAKISQKDKERLLMANVFLYDLLFDALHSFWIDNVERKIRCRVDKETLYIGENETHVFVKCTKCGSKSKSKKEYYLANEAQKSIRNHSRIAYCSKCKKQFFVPRIIESGVSTEHLKDNPYWKQLHEIETYLVGEYNNLKYGCSEKNIDPCLDCPNQKKAKKCEENCSMGRCPHLLTEKI